MAKFLTLSLLCLTALLAKAQESNRVLAVNYRPQPVEQAIVTLTAANRIDARTVVEYKAGQAVVLQPGFEARAGSVFTAHTGAVELAAWSGSEAEPLVLNAYPNPFQKATTITYALAKAGKVNLRIRDASGRQVSQPVEDRYQEAGSYQVEWTGDQLPAGNYLYSLEVGSLRVSKRLIKK